MPPDAAVCEVGWADVCITEEETTVGPPRSQLVNPGRPIPVEARAIHHIGDDDVRNSPDCIHAFEAVTEGGRDDLIYCAHNAAFERNWFNGGPCPWICTLKVARRLWPECPSHSNQCVRYFLGINLDPRDAMPPHRAAPDAFVTAHILARALKEATVEDMIEWTKQPSLLPRIPFGKHRGKKWSEAPTDYLDWILRQADMDADVKFTARHWLKEMAA